MDGEDAERIMSVLIQSDIVSQPIIVVVWTTVVGALLPDRPNGALTSAKSFNKIELKSTARSDRSDPAAIAINCTMKKRLSHALSESTAFCDSGLCSANGHSTYKLEYVIYHVKHIAVRWYHDNAAELKMICIASVKKFNHLILSKAATCVLFPKHLNYDKCARNVKKIICKVGAIHLAQPQIIFTSCH